MTWPDILSGNNVRGIFHTGRYEIFLKTNANHIQMSAFLSILENLLNSENSCSDMLIIFGCLRCDKYVSIQKQGRHGSQGLVLAKFWQPP